MSIQRVVLLTAVMSGLLACGEAPDAVESTAKAGLQPETAAVKPAKASAPRDTATKQAVTDIPDFASIPDVKAKKKAFFGYLAPKIHAVNSEVWSERTYIMTVRQKAKAGALSPDEILRLFELGDRYGVDKPEDVNDKFFAALLERVDVVPASLVLAQAANESAWGTSRFARQGRNFFGIWCYTPGCGLTPKQRNAGAKHEVRVFPTVGVGVAHYANMVNSGRAYRELRTLRAKQRAAKAQPTGVVLAPGLSRYSERGPAYVREITHMIKQNNLSAYNQKRTIVIPPIEDEKKR